MYLIHTDVSGSNAFEHAEKLAGRYFRLVPSDERHHYDVKTLAYLDKHEVDDRVFAQLCKYIIQRR